MLFEDSPGKSNISDSSARYSEITREGSFKSTDEDGSLVWFIQANGSSNNDENEDENEIGECENEAIQVEYEEEEEEDIYGILELCNGLSRICLQKKRLPELEGRHIRFTYNSDDEIVREEKTVPFVSPSVLCLNGLLKPMYKHLGFPKQNEEEEHQAQ